MHPTLRPVFEFMGRLVRGLGSERLGAERPRGKRRLAPAVAPLEGRELMAFAQSIASAVPSTLWPPNGRLVPVLVSGQFNEFVVINNKQVFKNIPGPKNGNLTVVDEYHRYEPYGPVHLTNEGGGKYTYSFTIFLQASRATEYPAGRRYYITVAAEDRDGWNGKTIPVQVPISLTDRGPGPVVAKPHAKARSKPHHS